jgi:hypothetical protein
LENEDTSMDNIKVVPKGLRKHNGWWQRKQSQAMVFPWAIAVYQNKEVNIPLLKNRMGATTTEMVIGSVQHLEYSISDALNKVTTVKQNSCSNQR